MTKVWLDVFYFCKYLLYLLICCMFFLLVIYGDLHLEYPFIYNYIWALKSLFYWIRFCVVYSYIEEEDVQISIWSVCMDTYDSDCGVYTVILYRGQYLRRNILVTYLSQTPFLLMYTYFGDWSCTDRMYTYICMQLKRGKKKGVILVNFLINIL